LGDHDSVIRSFCPTDAIGNGGDFIATGLEFAFDWVRRNGKMGGMISGRILPIFDKSPRTNAGGDRLTCVKSVILMVGLLVGLILAGCGGGGGSSSGGTGLSVTYRTAWGASSGSQVVTLESGARAIIGTRVLNQSAGQTETVFTDLSAGTYRVIARHHAGNDGNGALLGELETPLNVTSNLTANTATTGTATEVRVEPTSLSLTVGGSRILSAYARTSSGATLFTPPSGFGWTAVGAAASISNSGLATGVQLGQGTINVRHFPSNLIAPVNVNVTPSVAPRTKWTILVYMNAASDLHPFSVLNVNQMESIAQNSDVRFVLQWKQTRDIYPNSSFDGTRRMLVKPDTTGAIASEVIQDMGTEVDMGDKATLTQFINWGKTNYPADRYGIVMWSHGNGWRRGERPSRAASYDDQTGNAIQIWELADAIGQDQFEFLAWDMSLMQMTEVAYEIKDSVDYVVGSEESPPGEGYPYDTVFSSWRDNPNASTRQLLQSFVTATLAVPEYANRKISQSVVETAQLTNLAAAIDTLSGSLIDNLAELGSTGPFLRANAQVFGTGRPYYDLHHMCTLLKSRSEVPTIVKNNATAVQNAITAAVAWEGNNSLNPNANGLSIEFSSGQSFSPFAVDYGRMKLAQDTRWEQWLSQAP